MDNGTAVTWILTNGCSWTPHSRPREIIQNEQRRLSNNKSKWNLFIKYISCACKNIFLKFFRDRGMMACLQILDHAGKEKWNQVPFYWSATILTPPSLFQSNLNHNIIPVMVLSVYVQLCREKLSIKLGSISI